MDFELRPLQPAWQPAYASGDAARDARHQALLAGCGALAAQVGSADEAAFLQAFEALKAEVLAHLAAEAREAASPEDAEEAAADADEFAALCDDVATAEHFDALELQRFVALWCVAHLSR